MSEYKVYITMAVFIALTAAKLLFPEYPGAIYSMVSSETEYREFVQTIGECVAEIKNPEELAAVFMQNRSESKETEQTATYTLNTIEISLENDTKPLNTPQVEDSKREVPENVRTDKPELPFEYICPVAGLESSGFGYREHPIDKQLKFHYGTDFAAPQGEEVLAFGDGYVYAAGESDSYGKYIILTHNGAVSTLYAHLSAVLVQEGAMVEKGQVIAQVGQTGKATGPHLHFEILVDDIYINPEYYI